jgi:hypothetical protein
MEKVMWLVLGATVMVASLRADRSQRARLVARIVVSPLLLNVALHGMEQV